MTLPCLLPFFAFLTMVTAQWRWQMVLEQCPVGTYVNFPTEADREMTRMEVEFYVDRFLGINDISEYFQIAFVVTWKWHVPCLRSKIYNNESWPKQIKFLSKLPIAEFWTPDFIHRNAIMEDNSNVFLRKLMINLEQSNFILDTSGSARSYCDLDFFYFPFDEQSCYIEFTMCLFNDLIDVKSASMTKGPNRTNVIPRNSNWYITSMTPKIIKNDVCQSAILQINFKRKHFYYTLNLLVPFAMLNILELSIFLVPPDSPDRSMFSAAIMLSIIVLDVEILSNIPKTPQNVVMAYYMSAVGIFSMVCTIYSAFICCFIYYFPSKSRGLFVFGKNGKQLQLCTLIDIFTLTVALIFVIFLYSATFSLVTKSWTW